MSRVTALRNIVGAFSDGAVLFPLLAMLSLKTDLSAVTLLASTGIIYVVAAAFFRVPMAVQPLKSIAVASLAIGATAAEVRMSGFAIGVICTILALTKIDRVTDRVPQALIHQLQVGLGVLLFIQGATVVAGGSVFTALVVAALMVFFPELAGLPLLGIVATVGLGLAISSGEGGATATSFPQSPMRPMLILGLVLPQLFLTMGNSVLATRNVCERYFGQRAQRVTVRNLLCSIGLGNIFVALCGGLPFCHGSGGVTAHVRGGSSHAWSTALMGAVLLTIAAAQYFSGTRVLIYPPLLVAPLLMATGVFHMQLAAPTSRSVMGKLKLITAVVVTIATRNLIWVLCTAAFFEIIEIYGRRFHIAPPGSNA